MSSPPSEASRLDRQVVVGVQAHARKRGVRREVPRPGVDGASAWVGVAVEQRGELREAALAGVAVVDDRVRLEVARHKVADLHGCGADDDHDDGAADALRRLDGAPLVPREREVVRRSVGVGVHLLVLPLLAGTGHEHDARGLGPLGDAVVDGGGVLVDAAVAAQHGARLARGGGALRLLEGLGVAGGAHGVRRRVVDQELREALLGGHGVDRPLGRAARGELPVDRAEVGAPKWHDRRALRQRQDAGVLEEHRALVLDLGRHLVGGLLCLCGVRSLRGGSRHIGGCARAAAKGRGGHGTGGNSTGGTKKLPPGDRCLSHGYSSPSVTCTL